MKKSTIIFTLLFFTLFIGVSNLYAQDGGEKYKIAAIQHQDMILFSDAFDGFKQGRQ
ncbi:MAG: hypothetical protein HQK64_13495 [Desulfamplus sp.]|nr:hypothetical protein [Desulfamplus sp.]